MSYDPTPICIPCKKEMSCLKNSVPVMYYYDDGSPYKIKAADLYQCNRCNNQMVKGFSEIGIETWMEQWDKVKAMFDGTQPEFRIEVYS